MKWIEQWTPLITVGGSILIAIYFVNISNERQLTGFENALFQIFILAAGLVGSFFIGKRFAKETAKEQIKPQARSAFRRMLSLYQSLSRVANEIERFQSSTNEYSKEIVLAILQAIVTEQIITADDALEDWSDIIPEDVNELRERLSSRNRRQSNE